MTDVFGGGNQPTNINSTTESDNDIVASLVGEGKKFKTLVDLAKGKIEADQFIERLKEEQAEMRATLKGQDEILQRLQRDKGNVPAPTATTPEVNEGALSEVVDRIITSRTVAQRREDNLKASVEHVRGVYGTDAAVKEAIANKAASLGLSPDKLKEIAEDSPQAFLSIMGVGDKANAPMATATKPSHTAVRGTQESIKNSSYYNNLRKELGARYWDAKVQNEIFKSRQELGDRFYS